VAYWTNAVGQRLRASTKSWLCPSTGSSLTVAAVFDAKVVRDCDGVHLNALEDHER